MRQPIPDLSDKKYLKIFFSFSFHQRFFLEENLLQLLSSFVATNNLFN